jgi:hypothetical protein
MGLLSITWLYLCCSSIIFSTALFLPEGIKQTGTTESQKTQFSHYVDDIQCNSVITLIFLVSLLRKSMYYLRM